MEFEFLSGAFLSALLAIVLIDLVLAGDNALIIGLVARNLPRPIQRKVIFWGTFGAIATRGLMAVLVVYILDLPAFLLAGGLAVLKVGVAALFRALRPGPRQALGKVPIELRPKTF